MKWNYPGFCGWFVYFFDFWVESGEGKRSRQRRQQAGAWQCLGVQAGACRQARAARTEGAGRAEEMRQELWEEHAGPPGYVGCLSAS